MSDFLIEPPVGEPAACDRPAPSARPAALGGIDWAGIAGEARGEVALVDIEPGEGELQEWGRRGDA